MKLNKPRRLDLMIVTFVCVCINAAANSVVVSYFCSIFFKVKHKLRSLRVSTSHSASTPRKNYGCTPVRSSFKSSYSSHRTHVTFHCTG